MRTFVENRGVRLPEVDRAGAFQLIRDAQVRNRVLDQVFSAHLGFDVKGAKHEQYASPIRPEQLTSDELRDAIGVMTAQKSRLQALQAQIVQDARDEAERLKKLASNQFVVLHEHLANALAACPYFANEIQQALNKAQDRANAAQRQRVSASDHDFSSPHATGHIPDSLEIALDQCTRELAQRTAVEQAENAKLRAMLERAGVSL